MVHQVLELISNAAIFMVHFIHLTNILLFYVIYLKPKLLIREKQEELSCALQPKFCLTNLHL